MQEKSTEEVQEKLPRNLGLWGVWMLVVNGLIGAGISGQLEIDFEILMPFIFAVLIGGFIGSKYGSQVVPQYGIKYLLIFVLVIASVKRISMLLM